MAYTQAEAAVLAAIADRILPPDVVSVAWFSPDVRAVVESVVAHAAHERGMLRGYLPARIAQTLPEAITVEEAQDQIAALREIARARQIGESLGQLSAEMIAGGTPPSTAYDRLRSLLATQGDTDSTTTSHPMVIAEAMHRLLTPHVPVVRSDIPSLDDALAALEPGDVMIEAARPSMGKSRLLRQIIRSTAAAGTPVFAVMLEERPERVPFTWAQQDGFPVARRYSREHPLSPVEAQAIADRLIEYNDLPVTYSTEHSFDALVSQLYQFTLAHKSKPALIAIDYLQLLWPPVKKGGYSSRQEEVSAISQRLKALAMTLGVVVLAVSQLSRGVDSRQDKHPGLSDLRESGSLEQDADAVLFIYRDAYYTGDTAEIQPADLTLDKMRNGPTGDLPGVVYNSKLTVFLSEDDVPIPVGPFAAGSV